MSKGVRLQFVWSDDLARLLIEAEDATPTELAHWTVPLIGHRLPDGMTPLEFARSLRERETSPDARLAS